MSSVDTAERRIVLLSIQRITLYNFKVYYVKFTSKRSS